MSDIKAFLKVNKTLKENVFYPATASLKDEGGSPLMWEIKHVTSKENDELQESCMKEIPVAGKPGRYRQVIKTTEYIRKLVAASVAFPDLMNAELQNSYGALTPEGLVQEIVDDSGEWNEFIKFINNLNGFAPIQDDVDEAKN